MTGMNMYMNIPLSSASKQIQVPPLVNFKRRLHLESFFPQKDKVVIIMGATGTGKTRLAIDLAAHFASEVVNSDKMQAYKGLDIVTNKVTAEECRGVPHHLLGIANPDSDFTANDFCNLATTTIDSILQRDRLPIIAGGSNSYLHALVNGDTEFRLRYECCFLWVDVSLPILHSFLTKRVDRTVMAGLVDEVRQIFDPMADYNRGIRRAIGVPELDKFLRTESISDDETKRKLLETAIGRIKFNNCLLACRQLQKIHCLNSMWEWNMHRIDATEAFNGKSFERAEEAWGKLVVARSVKIVDKFLCDKNKHVAAIASPEIAVEPPPISLATAATH